VADYLMLTCLYLYHSLSKSKMSSYLKGGFMEPRVGVALRTLSVVASVVALNFAFFAITWTEIPQAIVATGFAIAAVALWVWGSRVANRE